MSLEGHGDGVGVKCFKLYRITKIKSLNHPTCSYAKIWKIEGLTVNLQNPITSAHLKGGIVYETFSNVRFLGERTANSNNYGGWIESRGHLRSGFEKSFRLNQIHLRSYTAELLIEGSFKFQLVYQVKQLYSNLSLFFFSKIYTHRKFH